MPSGEYRPRKLHSSDKIRCGHTGMRCEECREFLLRWDDVALSGSSQPDVRGVGRPRADLDGATAWEMLYLVRDLLVHRARVRGEHDSLYSEFPALKTAMCQVGGDLKCMGRTRRRLTLRAALEKDLAPPRHRRPTAEWRATQRIVANLYGLSVKTLRRRLEDERTD